MNMSSELEAIMKRRRRRADGKVTPPVTTPERPSVGRKSAPNEIVPPRPPPPPAPAPAPAPAPTTPAEAQDKGENNNHDNDDDDDDSSVEEQEQQEQQEEAQGEATFGDASSDAMDFSATMHVSPEAALTLSSLEEQAIPTTPHRRTQSVGLQENSRLPRKMTRSLSPGPIVRDDNDPKPAASSSDGFDSMDFMAHNNSDNNSNYDNGTTTSGDGLDASATTPAFDAFFDSSAVPPLATSPTPLQNAWGDADGFGAWGDEAGVAATTMSTTTRATGESKSGWNDDWGGPSHFDKASDTAPLGFGSTDPPLFPAPTTTSGWGGGGGEAAFENFFAMPEEKTPEAEPEKEEEEEQEDEIMAYPEPPPLDADVSLKESSEITLQRWPLWRSSAPSSAVRLPPPTLHPLTGNLIRCRCRGGSGGSLSLEEFHPGRQVVMASTSVLSPDLVRAVRANFDKTAVGVKVVHVAAGLHRQQGRLRCRVAAFLELVVLTVGPPRGIGDPAVGVLSSAPESMLRVVAVWQWGYGSSKPVALQSVLAPPPSCHAHTLCVADGLLFLGGHHSSCVYLAKPSVRDAWVTCPIAERGNNTTAVAALAVTVHPHRSFKYLAVACGATVSVWTYDAAVATNRLNLSAGAAIADDLLQPLCKLDTSAATTVMTTEPSSQGMLWNLAPHAGNYGTHTGEAAARSSGIAMCSHLSWMPPGSSVSSIMLLAAAFDKGVCIYHVSLPLQMDLTPLPTDSVSELSVTSEDQHGTAIVSKMQRSSRSTGGGGGRGGLTKKNSAKQSLLTNAAIIAPIAAAKFVSAAAMRISWMDMGPRCPPCVAVYLRDGTNGTLSHLAVGVLDLPLYSGATAMMSAADGPRPLFLMTKSTLTSSQYTKDASLVTVTSISSAVVSWPDGEAAAFSPVVETLENAYNVQLKHEDSFFPSLTRPVVSLPPGLDSLGHVRTASPDDEVLHVFSVLQCRRRNLQSLASRTKTSARLDWTTPVQRHWLCCTRVGDRVGTPHNPKSSNSTVGGGGASAGGGGSASAGGGGGMMGDQTSEGQSTARFADDEVSRRGADTTVICELTCGDSTSTSMTPQRIVRAPWGGHCAVLFHSGLRSTSSLFWSDAIAYGIVDVVRPSKKSPPSSFELRHGRDVAFFSSSTGVDDDNDDDDEKKLALVLSLDGTRVMEFVAATNTSSSSSSVSGNTEETAKPRTEWIEQKSVEIGGSHDMIWRRLCFMGKTRLALAGSRMSDGRSCLALGPNLSSASKEDTTTCMAEKLLPLDMRHHAFWFEKGEELVSWEDLAAEGEVEGCLAVASQSRVILLNRRTLKFVVSVQVQLTSDTLAPLGAHCVAFCCATSGRGVGGGGARIQYLSQSCGSESEGIIATIPTSRFNMALLGLRPDRAVYLCSHSGARLVENGENEDSFVAPRAITKPVLLLEPLIANALSGTMDHVSLQKSLRSLMDRFGRKLTDFPHGDGEGIGVQSGVTCLTLELLRKHGCTQAASFLLTGTGSSRDLPVTNKVLPQWIPLVYKMKAMASFEGTLQVLSFNDPQTAAYLRSPEENAPAVLAKNTDVSALVAHRMAMAALQQGQAADAIKLLDIAGRHESETAIADLALASASLQKGEPSLLTELAAAHPVAAAAVALRQKASYNTASFSPLVPGVLSSRSRNSLLTAQAIRSVGGESKQADLSDACWKRNYEDSKNVWSVGPFEEKEELLLLDRMEEWLGRSRPAVMGKEGAAIAAESGEKALADILKAAAREDNDADNSFDGGENPLDVARDGWVDGVGESHLDEDNLSLYLRFSEGSDEDPSWRTDGLVDLTKYQQKCAVYGADDVNLEVTTSSVDEGEVGKVKLLYDYVSNHTADQNRARGILVDVARGGPLDVGMLHYPSNEARQRSSVEFWYLVPRSSEEVPLVRRSLCAPETDASSLCLAAGADSMLWELVVMPSGQLQFRTSGGSVLNSTDKKAAAESDGGGGSGGGGGNLGSLDNSQQGDAEEKSSKLVTWQREDGTGGWNHVCILFSSRSLPMDQCKVSLVMKGVLVASSVVSVVPPGMDSDQVRNKDVLDDALGQTAVMFAPSCHSGFRLTEVRVWSCERSLNDIRMMMYEYLPGAETKKKFKVKIRNRKGSSKVGMGGLLAPPKLGRDSRPVERQFSGTNLMSSSSSSPPPSRAIHTESSQDGFSDTFGFPFDDTKVPDVVAPDATPLEATTTTSIATTEVAAAAAEEVEPKDEQGEAEKPAETMEPPSPHAQNASNGVDDEEVKPGEIETTQSDADEEPSPREPTEDGAAADVATAQPPVPLGRMDREKSVKSQVSTRSVLTMDHSIMDDSSTLSLAMETTPLLSEQVRTSAAAAIIRGPPAARHFGGNRGGLARPFAGAYMDEDGGNGVGSITICGAEKTVVYSHNQNPPGRTYPVGASGAIISDVMDNEGSEYLSCFLAKEKRIVVFELQSKTVVIELQMTTKLNFWRYLPPEAHGNTLVFMLITPVGGFHWMPLDDSPRPQQVWRRGPELQGKKIVAYEEGGSNGGGGADARSTVALLLASSSTAGSPVEAWCLPIFGDSKALCFSSDALGAGFCRPTTLDENDPFFPLVVTAVAEEDNMFIEVGSVTMDQEGGSLVKNEVGARVEVNPETLAEAELPEPTMAMGSSPKVFCCSVDDYVVIVVRNKGVVIAYEYSERALVPVGRKKVRHYIVDAAARSGDVVGEIEVVLLLAIPDNPKDGRVATVNVSRIKGVC